MEASCQVKARSFLIAITEYISVHIDDSIDLREDGTPPQYGDLFYEEWVVWRSFRNFSSLHKVLKSIVNPAESSAGAGAKLVGAATGLATIFNDTIGLATAALTIGNSNCFGPVNPSFTYKAKSFSTIIESGDQSRCARSNKKVNRETKADLKWISETCPCTVESMK